MQKKHILLKDVKNNIKNGLKDILLFKELKPDHPIWSFPGKKN